MSAGIVLSVVLPHRARALAYVAFGGLAILVSLFLLLKPVTPPYPPEEAEPRAEVVDSGGWAIPERIVMCESSGQNLPSNEASAAGYYQITSEAWAEGDGSSPDDASRHSKAEQDAVASRLWAAGAGAGRWVCK
jgi:hypothetical protein